jgi:hypothetical protein
MLMALKVQAESFKLVKQIWPHQRRGSLIKIEEKSSTSIEFV